MFWPNLESGQKFRDATTTVIPLPMRPTVLLAGNGNLGRIAKNGNTKWQCEDVTPDYFSSWSLSFTITERT